MKKTMRAWMIMLLILCLCSTAFAVEPPLLDYEGFAADLMSQGITIPQTMEEALGDTDFGLLPEYELTVDEENERFILRTNLITEDVDIFSEDYSLFTTFVKTDEPGVYVASAKTTCRGDDLTYGAPLGELSEYSQIRMVTRHEKNPNVFPLWCIFDIETGRCEDYRVETYLTDTIICQKRLNSYGNGDGAFEYSIENESNGYDLEINFDISTGGVKFCRFWDWEQEASVNFYQKSMNQLSFEGYSYRPLESIKWTLDEQPCEAPFEVTPDLYPYPSFLPQ